MKKYIELYNPTKTYIFPNLTIATPDVMMSRYPAVNMGVPIAIETDEAHSMCYAINHFSAMRSNYSIDSSLSTEEALLAIEELLNTPEPVSGPSAEERVASALEYQNLFNS